MFPISLCRPVRLSRNWRRGDCLQLTARQPAVIVNIQHSTSLSPCSRRNNEFMWALKTHVYLARQMCSWQVVL